MKIRERLLECKIKLGIKTDYKLAQALKIDRRRISDYMAGKRKPDAYIAIKMADVLKTHPFAFTGRVRGRNGEKRRNKEFLGKFRAAYQDRSRGDAGFNLYSFLVARTKGGGGLP